MCVECLMIQAQIPGGYGDRRECSLCGAVYEARPLGSPYRWRQTKHGEQQ